MAQKGYLTVTGQGEIEVEQVTAFLKDLNVAYASVLTFMTIMDAYRREPWESPWASRYLQSGGFRYRGPDRLLQRELDWIVASEQVMRFVPYSERLVLSKVKLTSPGIWEFLGTLNPLEVVRKYISDRHERRKDRDYREGAESRRLQLENLSLENKVISERIRIAKELGATDRDLAPLLNTLLYPPLTTLNRHQDSGVIDGADLLPVDSIQK